MRILFAELFPRSRPLPPVRHRCLPKEGSHGLNQLFFLDFLGWQKLNGLSRQFAVQSLEIVPGILGEKRLVLMDLRKWANDGIEPDKQFQSVARSLPTWLPARQDIAKEALIEVDDDLLRDRRQSFFLGIPALGASGKPELTVNFPRSK